MKKQLTQKYLSFIIVAISFIYLISCQKDASRTTSVKIVYTDIIPDTMVVSKVTPSLYNLDLDKDGVYDFTFKCTYYLNTQCRPTGGSGFSGYVEVKPADNSFNEILNVVDTARLDTIPAALDTLNEISSSSGNWSSGSFQYFQWERLCTGTGGYHFEWGNWPDSSDKYLGLKLVKGTQIFFGWARLNVQVGFSSVGAVLILKDYAYNSSPNEFILAGQTK